MSGTPTASTGDLGPARGVPGLPALGEALADRYEVLEEVARGGMGAVFRARQLGLDRVVAVKVLLPGASPERFTREAQLLARVDSPHVVTIHDYALLPNGSPFVAMEWVEGGTLATRMRAAGGRLSEKEALPLMLQTAQGMAAAEQHGIVHRDLKPSNILTTAAGGVRVADFGLARGPGVDPECSVTGEVLGTPFYMAPEQWESPRALDGRADVYAYGATFYHALTGVVPFTGATAIAVLLAHKTEPLVSPRAHNKKLSERTTATLERCLAKSPRDRFASFAEIEKHLRPGASRSPWEPDDEGLEETLARYAARRELYVLRLLTPGEVDVYPFPGGRSLRVLRGNIVEQDAEALVSSDDGTLTMSDGVSKAIREAAGESIVKEARRHAPVRAGRAIVTSGGRLRARHVIHGISLEFSRDRSALPSRDLVSAILASCVCQADSLYVERIAFPLLGAGNAGLPEDVCLDTMFRFLARLLSRGLTGIREATIVLY
jgi:eukaryotic-like serine/threonine-protein kinase